MGVCAYSMCVRTWVLRTGFSPKFTHFVKIWETKSFDHLLSTQVVVTRLISRIQKLILLIANAFIIGVPESTPLNKQILAMIRHLFADDTQ